MAPDFLHKIIEQAYKAALDSRRPPRTLSASTARSTADRGVTSARHPALKAPPRIRTDKINDHP